MFAPKQASPTKSFFFFFLLLYNAAPFVFVCVYVPVCHPVVFFCAQLIVFSFPYPFSYISLITVTLLFFFFFFFVVVGNHSMCKYMLVALLSHLSIGAYY